MKNMIASERAIAALEFDKIRALLADAAPTKGAASLSLCLTPSDDRDEVARRLQRTTDAKRLYDAKGMPPFGSVPEVVGACERAEKGAVLSPRELLDVSRILRSSRQVADYFRQNHLFPTVLDEIADRLLPNKHLEDTITRSILSEDMIADEASPALADIRRKIREANLKIKETLQRYVSGSYSKILQDNIVTMRNGRYVVPVKVECKNDINGLIHDTSSSGATIFIEPMAVVEANNELRMLQSKEEREIERILYDLSSQVSASAESLRLNELNLTDLAFAFACAQLSIRMKGNEATLTRDHSLSLIRARHPLIDPGAVVPTNIQVGKTYDTLIITGPNTGGKTVALKTVGLFALMTQSGLHIPAEVESSLPVFDRILVDLGDEQSIEQSLSTFSSHMVNIVRIVQNVTKDSLCLFDELGAGTDPVEGAALARSIIEEVRAAGAICVATTHYTELKTYALEIEGVENASCEFDVTTLRPTYRLLIGLPGKSNAFAISEKLGLSKEIIERAKSHVNEEHHQFESLLGELEERRIAAERALEDANRLRAEYETLKAGAEAELNRKLANERRKVEEDRRRAENILQSAKSTSEFVLAQLEKAKKAEEAGKLTETLDETRRAVRRAIRENDDRVNPVEERENKGYVLPRALRKGDRVKLVNLGTEATVLELPDSSGNLLVQAGILKTRTPLANLQLIDEEPTVTMGGKRRPVSGFKRSPAADFRDEIDLRGKLGDEAWGEVDKYFDEALLTGFRKVRLIHGKGTGALKKALWERLRKDRRVASFRMAEYGEGDGGVTVVELK